MGVPFAPYPSSVMPNSLLSFSKQKTPPANQGKALVDTKKTKDKNMNIFKNITYKYIYKTLVFKMSFTQQGRRQNKNYFLHFTKEY